MLAFLLSTALHLCTSGLSKASLIVGTVESFYFLHPDGKVGAVINLSETLGGQASIRHPDQVPMTLK